MRNIGLHHYIREHKRLLGYSPIGSDDRRRVPMPPLSHLISTSARRIFRRGGTVGGWNDFVTKAAYELSGNPQQTLIILLIDCPDRNRSKPIALPTHSYGASPKRAFWGRDSRWSMERLERMRERARKKAEQEREARLSKCYRCGAGSSGTGFMKVCIRYDVYSFMFEDIFRRARKAGDPHIPKWEELVEQCNLCVRCWNRMTPFIRMKREAKEIQRQTNKLKKELRNERKEHHRQDSCVPRLGP